ncbi:MAG TPA: FHA domain-containing protein [Anaerolineales bacterium]|nr:FHA domain-containing protein [Anaerolineales bacterium]HNO31998.1 FHA domain-containing protein [Anaerolineales bacterium]HUM28353.1 FHA domain-containing protein [Anaerolineales bacterium]
MIVCSNCKHANMAGAMFCAECGAQLVGRDALITQTIATDKFKGVGKKPGEDLYQSFDGTDAWGSLHLLDTGQVLPLSSRTEFTMGRISEGQPIMPDIDLSPYQAYAAGVSRLHAVIRRDGMQIVFMDLGSANGTYINGKRLSPNVEQVLNHGDIIALGKLKMQILVKDK